MLGVWLALALSGPLLVDPAAVAVNLSLAWDTPSAAHWLGCDQLGRDVLGRLTLGAWAALVVAVPGAGLAILVGGGLGALAGMARGWVDAAVHHLIEVSMAFPRLMLALAASALMSPGLGAVAMAFAVAAWPAVARPTRTQVIGLRHEEFVRAASALGASAPRILRRHILPHLWPAWLARSGGLAAQAILLESALGFMGIGAQEPQPSWGGMIRDGLPMLAQAPAMALSAGLAIFAVALAANLLADDLSGAFDQRRG